MEQWYIEISCGGEECCKVEEDNIQNNKENKYRQGLRNEWNRFIDNIECNVGEKRFRL